MQTHYSINEKYFKNFNELKDRREIESISTSPYFSSTDVFCSDLSAFAQFKSNVMQNTSESQLAQNSINTTVGFYNTYFSYLKTSTSVNEAFLKASLDYFNLNHSFKYQSYKQFKTSIYGNEC